MRGRLLAARHKPSDFLSDPKDNICQVRELTGAQFAKAGLNAIHTLRRRQGNEMTSMQLRADMYMVTVYLSDHPKAQDVWKDGHHAMRPAMKAGAIDFLTKPFRDQDLLDAVTRALDRDRKRRDNEKGTEDLRAKYVTLTAREKQIMALVTDGLMNKQIASRLEISQVTAKIHRGKVMRKLGAKSLADLVVMAESLGVRGKLPQET